MQAASGKCEQELVRDLDISDVLCCLMKEMVTDQSTCDETDDFFAGLADDEILNEQGTLAKSWMDHHADPAFDARLKAGLQADLRNGTSQTSP